MIGQTWRAIAVAGVLVLSAGAAWAASWSPGVEGMLLETDNMLRAGKYDQALVKYAEALKLEKDPSNQIEIKIRTARVHLFKGGIGRARFALTQLSRTTTDVRAWIETARAFLYYSPYKVAEARYYVGLALGAEPNNLDALLESGYCDLNSGDQKKAKQTFEQVLKKDARMLRAHYGLAKINFLNKEFSKAIDRLKLALSIAPENAETMHLLGNVYLGSSEPRAKEASMNWIARAADQDPANIKYLAAGIFAGLCRLQPADAENFRKRVAAVDPQNSYVIWTQGVYLELNSKVVEAYEKYLDALSKDWGNLYAHFSIANMYTGYGNPEYVMTAETDTWRYSRFKNVDKGVEHFETIVNSGETFPYLHEAKHRLRSLYDEPGKPDWNNPGFVKKLEKMRDYGNLLRTY